MEQHDGATELETYNQHMKWLEEAKSSFSSWYDRQTKNKQVTAATAYIQLILLSRRSFIHVCDQCKFEGHTIVTECALFVFQHARN